MKRNLLIGRRVLRNGLVLTTTLLTCVALQANDENKTGAGKAHKEHADKGGPMTAEKFVQKSMASGQMEVQMGQLGQKQAQNQQVKSLAAALVRDHTQANQKLQQIASTKNITPDRAGQDHQKHQKHLDKLRSQSGAEFDKEFVKMALKHHKKDISEFERAQNQVDDPQLKSFITETLPKLRQHYQMAQTAARQVGVDEASIAAEIETDDASAAGGAAAGVKGSVDTERNRSLDGATQTDDSGTINQNTQDRATEDKDLSLSTDADVEADVDADVDDNKIFQEGDGKVLGLPTSKTDGKFLGIIPNPNADDDADADAEIEADVDVDADDDAVGGSADIETGTKKDQ